MPIRRTVTVNQSRTKQRKLSFKKRRKFIRPSNLGLNQTRPELKSKDYVLTDPTIPLSSTDVARWTVNAVAQGTDNTNRIGKKVQVKSLSINAVFRGPHFGVTASTMIGSMVRWWVVLDSQPDGVKATADEIWDLAGFNYMYAHRNLGNSERFKVLRTGTVDLAPTGSTASLPAIAPGFEDKKYVNIYIPLNDAVRFGGTDGTEASINSGAYLFCYTCDNQGASSGPSVSFNARVKFTDQ